ncbi:MAG TPA: amidase [Candidatus Limnocylindrales bacterium]|nr:amidase [Candidatus Limnocylindrales bacterium]
MTHDDLAFADATELQRLLTARTVSSVELTELYLARLEKYGPVYNAVVTILHDRARREAKRADAERARGRVRGPLHGIPYGVKDLLATPDAPTTWGAQPYREQRFAYDATVVKKLSAAGAVLLAKLAMVELAGGFGYGDADASFTGPGRTPWNAKYWSGGSSSGSGIAAAAGLVGFAIGSETSGSILFPSTACGVTGLRPTYGRVSRHGAMALCWTLDKLGPLARSARDAETILGIIAGADPNDLTAVDGPLVPPRRRLRVAVLKDGTKASMPEVVANFRASLKTIATFADVAGEVALPKGPWGPVVGTIVDAEGAAAFRDLIESGRSHELRNADDKLGGYVAYATPAVDYIDAMRQRAKLNAALERAMDGYDAIVSPTLPTVTYPVGLPFEKAWPKYPGATSLISPGNLAGLPAIAMPNGMGPENLPTSIAFLGRAWGEPALTALAKSYQRATAFHTKRPRLTTAVPH